MRAEGFTLARLLMILSIFPILVGCSSGEGASKRENDLELLQGTWEEVQPDKQGDEVGGRRRPRPPQLLKIEGKRFRVWREGEDGSVEGTFEIDSGKDPKSIDWTITNRVQGGVSIEGEKGLRPGLYELDGDTLRLCLSDGKCRPDKLENTQDSEVAIWRRVQK